MPQPLETEIRGYNNVFDDEEVKFKWVTVYSKLGKYDTKALALAELEDEVKAAKAGNFSNTLKKEVYSECGKVNGMHNSWKLNEAMKYVNELIGDWKLQDYNFS
jgi:hypothetical protein